MGHPKYEIAPYGLGQRIRMPWLLNSDRFSGYNFLFFGIDLPVSRSVPLPVGKYLTKSNTFITFLLLLRFPAIDALKPRLESATELQQRKLLILMPSFFQVLIS